MTNNTKTEGTLLKVSCLLTRRPDLSHEDFHRYWTEKHTPMLARPVPGSPTVHRYVQLYPVSENVPALHTAPYDGIAEIWFDTLADAAMFTSDHYNTVVAKDEENFLDCSKTVFLYAHEKTII